MDVTEPGTVYEDPVFAAGYWISCVLALLNRTPFSEAYWVLDSPTVMDVREVHPWNALSMYVTESGMVTDVRELHP